MTTTYNRIQFESGPWGKTRGFQKLVDGAEVGLLDPEGNPLQVSGVQYSYKVIAENVPGPAPGNPPWVSPASPTPAPEADATPDEDEPPRPKKKRAASVVVVPKIWRKPAKTRKHK